MPEAQSPGVGSCWNSLAGGTEGGDCLSGSYRPDCSGRAAGSAAGELPGFKDKVAESSIYPQGSAQGKGQRQVGQGRRKGRKARGVPEGQRQGRREEVMSGPPMTWAGAGAMSQAMSIEVQDNGPPDVFREVGNTSYAAEGGVRADVLPDPSAMISPMEPCPVPLSDPVLFDDQGHVSFDLGHSGLDASGPRESERGKSLGVLSGSTLGELGLRVQQWLLEVVPLRGKAMGRRTKTTLLPLPTSSSFLLSAFPHLGPQGIAWLASIAMGLNSLWGDEVMYDGEVSAVALECMDWLSKDVERICLLEGRVELFDWDQFFSTRGIDYRGDEVKTAREFTWGNIAPALPAEIGRVPLEQVCTLGARHYVENLDLYIKPRDRWELVKPPRVMVPEGAWAEVCSGLLTAGICVLLPVEEVFHIEQQPLLNGLFGVTKDEWSGEYEVYRLIMNLTPFNGLAEPLKGDVETLPMWSQMSPFFLQPGESLLISSEDVRCFFYTMAVPPAWYKYLAFNKRVPDQCLPVELQGRLVYMASRVLPMGFANSVSLAQHVHRNLTLWSHEHIPEAAASVAAPEAEVRKDRPLTAANPSWRIYLDNFDLLEKVRAVEQETLEGSLAPAALALRQEYEKWEVPRNLKKSVQRQPVAEVQGAQVDGNLGVAFPRESKLLKYLAATLTLLHQPVVTQRQTQVVCGGLVYMAMFRRQLLGCLNAIWPFIESFDRLGVSVQALPAHCKLELVRFVALIPLARLDFRLEYSEQVTCSDASTSGGGVCASVALSRAGCLAAQGKLRGQLPELRQEHRVLTIGLFDGIGALRVAADLLGLEVMGHVSIEKEKLAQRVVSSHFPETWHFDDVTLVDEEVVNQWAREFSQAALVILGAGPPCQGVSGLNAGRKGALRDERSCLFSHVKRIWKLAKKSFPWCQVHCFMESVASMDEHDRRIMSQDFGEDPWKCDAGSMTWTSRPRLYWLSWELLAQEGVQFVAGSDVTPREVVLTAFQDLEQVCQEGWIKVDPSRPFPTFTTSRPRPRPGHKPAGLHFLEPGRRGAVEARLLSLPALPVHRKKSLDQQARRHAAADN